MPDLGRAALVVCLGLTLYAVAAGSLAAVTKRRRLAQSAQDALLAAFGAAAVLLNRHATRDLIAWVVPVLGLVGGFFAFLLVAVASPFDTQPAPADGAGLNPSLQNPYMLAHPPLLYLGYVGLTIPFAFALAAL